MIKQLVWPQMIATETMSYVGSHRSWYCLLLIPRDMFFSNCRSLMRQRSESFFDKRAVDFSITKQEKSYIKHMPWIGERRNNFYVF